MQTITTIGLDNNHPPEVAAMDFFVVPTIGFDLLYPSLSSG
jgi:hypothetical protein